MEQYVRFVVRHRWAVMLATLVATALFATQLLYLRLDIRRRAYMPQQHPYVQVQNRITEVFGGEAVAVIGLIVPNGDIFTPSILGKVYRITQRLHDIPGVIESSLFSLAGPHVKAVVAGSDNMMDIRPLMDSPSLSSDEIARLRRTVDEDRLFRGNLVAPDGSATVIVAEFDDRLSDSAIAARIEEILAPERDATVIFALAGSPILRAWLARYTALITWLFPIAVAVIGFVHYEAFRTLQAVFLPLLTALLSVVWALGIIGLSRQPMDTWSAITPVVILAVAAGHAVQILKRYYEEYARVGDNHLAVVRAVSAVGPVMLTAGCIAAAGFGSLTTFGVASVRAFGLLLALGILSALFIEMTFTPACRSLLPAPRRHELLRERQSYGLDRMLDALAAVVVRRPRTIVLVAVALAAVSLVGAASIQVDNSFRLWFAPGTQVRQDDALMNEKLPGTATIRLLVEGDADNTIQDPAVLQAIADLGAFMETDPQVGGVLSIADHVKRMNQAMNGGAPTFYRIPDNSRLIGQYLLLYSMATGPEGLSAFVDGSYRNAVIRALSKTDSAAFSRDLIGRLQTYATQRFEGLPVRVAIAGGTIGIQTAMNDVVVHDKILNMVQVGVIIFVLSAVVLRSVLGGLFVLIPLALAVLVTLGAMGWAGTWLDMTTAAITAMGVSIGADFAIYLVFRIREEWARTGSMAGAMSESLRTSGRAIFFVSSAVVLGYLVLPLSGFSIWTRLGILTALIISVSALATLTLIPALGLILQPRFLRGRVIAGSEPPRATDSPE